jgi:hypothetical protein
MEDALEVYQRPRDGACPVVCLDETSKRLISETRVPIPARSGRIARHDYEYARNGTANLFMLFALLKGWRHVKVTDHHASVDYAQVLKDLADTHFPDARRIVLVRDNLSLDRRIPNKQTLIDEVAAWQDRRNKHHTKTDWQFTIADARVKLKRLYPAI